MMLTLQLVEALRMDRRRDDAEAVATGVPGLLRRPPRTHSAESANLLEAMLDRRLARRIAAPTAAPGAEALVEQGAPLQTQQAVDAVLGGANLAETPLATAPAVKI
jgi:hypothetical protein